MAKPADDLSSLIQHLRFAGRESGLVKLLRGFKKTHHTVPDTVSAATTAFLGKLCGEDLSKEAEDVFQRVRTVFGYKRKELSLEVASPQALLLTKDFTFELSYSLNDDDPASYLVVRALRDVRNGDLLQTPEFESVFAGAFSEIVFALTKGAPVEAVIDAVEGLEGVRDVELSVSYPSDCRDCLLAVEGVSAEVKFDGSELAILFPRNGSPRELMEAFAAVREAFRLTKNKALSGLLG